MTITIGYEYRDAGNNRRSGRWTVKGRHADEAALVETLNEDGFFVPDAVGFPMLSPGADDWDGDLDHPFHSVISVTPGEEPLDDERSFDDVLRIFAAADWERAGVEHEMELGR